MALSCVIAMVCMKNEIVINNVPNVPKCLIEHFCVTILILNTFYLY